MQDHDSKIVEPVRIGLHQSVKDLLQDLTDHGIRIEDPEMIMNIDIAINPKEIEVVRIPVSDLHFDQGDHRREVHLFDRVRELGLDLVPAEVAPQVCLQYPYESLEEGIVVASEPVKGSGGTLNVFAIDRSGKGVWLLSSNGLPANFWVNDHKWVIARRKDK